MTTPIDESKNQGFRIKEYLKEKELIFESFSHETDRGYAIMSVCHLDNELEELIRASYIKDRKVNILFKNNQILQSFYNKVSIAFCSGLIPKHVYHDLMLVGEIRNKFAHGITANLKLNDKNISEKIDRFQILPDTHQRFSPRFKLNLVVSFLGGILYGYKESLLHIQKYPFIGIKLVDFFNEDLESVRNVILTLDEIEQIIKKGKGNTS